MMRNIKSICVYCGSNPGMQPSYMEAASELGLFLAENRIRLIYGGSDVGLMGALANTALKNGGEVIGVIPSSLAEKVGHDHLSKIYIVPTMHERKARMFELAEGFIALPGGLGTIEEIFEVLTWAQLKLHDKPCGFLNIQGYFDQLLAFLDHSTSQKFIMEKHRQTVLSDKSISGLFNQLSAYQAPSIEKWITAKENTDKRHLN